MFLLPTVDKTESNFLASFVSTPGKIFTLMIIMTFGH